MISNLLERKFLLDSTEALTGAFDQEATRQRDGDTEAVARGKEREVDANALDSAGEQIATDLSEALAEADDEAAYFPRQASLSLLQSALERFYRDRGLVTRPQGQGLLAEDVPISDVSLRGKPVHGDAGQELFGAFSQTDIGWVTCLVAEGVTALRGKRPFPAGRPAPRTVADDALVVLVGDWGSGLPRAQSVAKAIRRILAAAPDRERHVIHLGDVYYSGWNHEYDDNFLAYWPVSTAEATAGNHAITSWCLNANHDMYSGGHGYFDHLLVDPRFAAQRGLSCFHLETNHWQILGLDTAWEDAELAGGQAAWIETVRRGAPKKNAMLLSHHQLWSVYEDDSPKLLDQLGGVLDEGLVDAWFWGHEHRCAVYEPRHGVRYGRCVGHGGVPVWASDGSPRPGIIWEATDALERGLERFARFGFAVLDFEGPNLEVSYRGESGEEQYRETLVGKPA